ncbi:MAG: hypothetical protein ACE5G9_03125 [Nitrospinales bacterium]
MKKLFNQPSVNILAAFLLLVPPACAHKPAWSKSSGGGAFSFSALSSSAAKPDWIMNPPGDPANLYFVGMNTAAESLDQGQDAAIKSAMGKIANYLGTKIDSVSEQNITETEQNLKLQIKAKSKARVQGANVEDWFAEKNDGRYDVYVLVKMPKSQIGRELARREREKSARANAAYDLYLRGRETESQKSYHQAADFYKQALDILKELDDLALLNRDGVNNTRDLLSLLQTAHQSASTAARQLALSIKVIGPEGAERAFIAGLAAALEQDGFKRNREDAAIEISGEVSALESGFALNNYVFYAEGQLSALRKSDRRIIGTAPFKTKAFGPDKTTAALNALTQAAGEAGRNLARILLETENRDPKPAGQQLTP